MAEVTYLTENLIAGKIITDQVPLAADTYYPGMRLEYDADNDRYKAFATNCDAIYAAEEDTKAAGDVGSVIVWGEVYEGGLVDDSGDALTVTEDIRAAMRLRGFFVKRV